MTRTRITDRQLRAALIIGLAAIVVWFAATRTTLLLAYGKNSSPLTLNQVQGVCDSSMGLIARNLSAQGAANCASVDIYSMWLNVAGFAGLMLAIASAALIAYRSQHQPARSS